MGTDELLPGIQRIFKRMQDKQYCFDKSVSVTKYEEAKRVDIARLSGTAGKLQLQTRSLDLWWIGR